MSIYKDAGPLLRSDTRWQAHKAIAPHKSALQRIVLDVLERTGGCSCDHVECVTGLAHQTCSARFTELRNAGTIYDCGERSRTRSGRSAAVYRVRK